MGERKRLYLDVCCLSRLSDEQVQDRVRLEAEAVSILLGHFSAGRLHWIASDVVDDEAARNPDPDARGEAETLVRRAHDHVDLDPTHVERARNLQAMGFRGLDALHVACAESAGADVLLTTDDGLIRKAARHSAKLRVRVANPLAWLEEWLAS